MNPDIIVRIRVGKVAT